MRIGELADKVGTSLRALRYYESQGLLGARRAANGYRDYDELDLRVVREIRSLLAIGFALEETRPFVACLRAGNSAGDACPDSVAVYRRKIEEIDECVDRLRAVREHLETQLERAKKHKETACPRLPRTCSKVTAATFEQEVLRSELPVVVDLWATWCGPCRMIAPALAEIAAEHAGRIRVVKLNFDENPAVGARYSVLSLPTLLVFSSGELIRRIVGSKPKAKLLAALGLTD